MSRVSQQFSSSHNHSVTQILASTLGGKRIMIAWDLELYRLRRRRWNYGFKWLFKIHWIDPSLFLYACQGDRLGYQCPLATAAIHGYSWQDDRMHMCAQYVLSSKMGVMPMACLVCSSTCAVYDDRRCSRMRGCFLNCGGSRDNCISVFGCSGTVGSFMLHVSVWCWRILQ